MLFAKEDKKLTNQNKLQITTEFIFEKEKEKILSELFWNEKYNGCVDIWFEYKQINNELELKVNHKKILNLKSKESFPKCLRYQVIPNKGIKQIF
jgi:hypothetical protein